MKSSKNVGSPINVSWKHMVTSMIGDLLVPKSAEHDIVKWFTGNKFLLKILRDFLRVENSRKRTWCVTHIPYEYYLQNDWEYSLVKTTWISGNQYFVGGTFKIFIIETEISFQFLLEFVYNQIVFDKSNLKQSQPEDDDWPGYRIISPGNS